MTTLNLSPKSYMLVGNANYLPLPDNSVDCVVTSIPYYGLRDYGVPPTIFGGDPNCQHTFTPTNPTNPLFGQMCEFCGAWLGTLGNEPTPSLFFRDIELIFRSIWRVLKPTGVVWLNVGDSYNGSGGAGGDYLVGGKRDGQPKYPGRKFDNIPEKSMMMIPHSVARALSLDGWILRYALPWIRRGSTPESAKDRPTTAIEYVFLLSKSKRYFFDAEAVRIFRENTLYMGQKVNHIWRGTDWFQDSLGFINSGGQGMIINEEGEPLSIVANSSSGVEGHFATMPVFMAEMLVLSGSPVCVCAECGEPYQRIIERNPSGYSPEAASQRIEATGGVISGGTKKSTLQQTVERKTIGFEPICTCGAEKRPAVVLDPFFGSGTTGIAAVKNGRACIGVDIKQEFIEIAKQRLLPGVQIRLPLETGLL